MNSKRELEKDLEVFEFQWGGDVNSAFNKYT